MKRLLLALIVLFALTAVACGDDDGTDAADEPAEEPAAEEPAAEEPAAEEPADAEMAAVADVCPNPLILQTDWFPSPEHAYAYHLIGDAGELDAENGVFRGPLLDTGIDLEIRAGGPYLGFEPTTSTMGVHQGIHLGYVSTDQQVAAWDSIQLVSVAAPLETNPQILMWDPATYDFDSFEDIGESGVTVNHFAAAVYADYMVQAGILQADQVDPSYDGSPARFIAEGGAIVQQGFATSEPWMYENYFEEWMKPVDFLLVHDSGFEIYSQTLVVRQAALEELRPCLELVVPLFQQAVVDHWTDPEPINELLVQIVEDLNSFWVLVPGQMEYSARTAVELGNVGNGPDDTVGNFDADRMTGVVDLLKDVMDDIPEDLETTDLYTNEFIDESIGF